MIFSHRKKGTKKKVRHFLYGFCVLLSLCKKNQKKMKNLIKALSSPKKRHYAFFEKQTFSVYCILDKKKCPKSKF